jgi:hypothetical protein
MSCTLHHAPSCILDSSTPTGPMLPKAAKKHVLLITMHQLASRLRSKAAHLPPLLLLLPLLLISTHPPANSSFFFFCSSASKSVFQSPRELFPEVCDFCVCLSTSLVDSIFLRLISLLKLFAPSINPSQPAALQRAVLLPSAIFVFDRPFSSSLLIHSDRRDCRWSAFSNSSTYLLRTPFLSLWLPSLQHYMVFLMVLPRQ